MECEAVRGTEYRSSTERVWFLEVCKPPPEPPRVLNSIPNSVNASAEALVLSGTVQEQFTAGWYAGGGSSDALAMMMCIVPLESGWRTTVVGAGGPFYGLLQFLASTWSAVGGGDWTDAWTQGHNGAKLWNSASPATQWPVAYRVCAG